MHCPDAVDLAFSHMHGFTDFYNPVHPVHLVGSRVLLRPHRLSPSERRVCFPSYRACDRARGPHMVSDRCINRWYVSPIHGTPPPAMPSPRHCSSSTLPTHHSKSTSSCVGSPPPPSPVPLAVFIVVNLATLSGNAMTITNPALPILCRYTHLQLLLMMYCLFITGHPFLVIPLLPQVTFNQRYPAIPSELFLLLLPWALKSLFHRLTHPDKGDDNDCIITNFILPQKSTLQWP